MKLKIKCKCNVCNGNNTEGSTNACFICLGKGIIEEIIEIIDYEIMRD